MAWLNKVRAGGKMYVYLTRYVGEQNYTTKKEQHIYSFGPRQLALKRMRRWKKDFSKFPKELLELGYTELDLQKWIQCLENENKKRVAN